MLPAAHQPGFPDKLDAGRRELCGALFLHPEFLADTLTHEVRAPFRVATHAHADLLQLTVLDGCSGRATAGDQSADLSGITAIATPPGVPHGYELKRTPGRAGRVYHVKLKCDRDSAAVKAGGLAGIVTGIARADGLLAAMRGVVHFAYVKDFRPPLLLPRLAEVIALWPVATDSAAAGVVPAVGGKWSGDVPEGLAAAVTVLDARVESPPSLDELADIAGMSTRHLSRLFRAAFGCTPHVYSDARRLARAREMLLGTTSSVTLVANRMGFPSVAVFSRWFRQHQGVSPREYRTSPVSG